MRECWNWQTGTFEVRVSTTYGFKSRLAHQVKNTTRLCGVFLLRTAPFLHFSQVANLTLWGSRFLLPAFQIGINFVTLTQVKRHTAVWYFLLRSAPFLASL